MIMPAEGRRNSSLAVGSPYDHQINCFLAALEPEDFALLEPNLESVILPRGTVMYEVSDPIHFTYFPHDAIVSLVDVMNDGRLAEVAMFGRYFVQAQAVPPAFPSINMLAAIQARPSLQRLVLAYNKALLAQAYHTVACNAVHPVEARCCRWLLSMHDRLDPQFALITSAGER
jgi:hypothetical protein